MLHRHRSQQTNNVMNIQTWHNCSLNMYDNLSELIFNWPLLFGTTVAHGSLGAANIPRRRSQLGAEGWRGANCLNNNHGAAQPSRELRRPCEMYSVGNVPTYIMYTPDVDTICLGENLGFIFKWVFLFKGPRGHVELGIKSGGAKYYANLR